MQTVNKPSDKVLDSFLHHFTEVYDKDRSRVADVPGGVEVCVLMRMSDSTYQYSMNATLADLGLYSMLVEAFILQSELDALLYQNRVAGPTISTSTVKAGHYYWIKQTEEHDWEIAQSEAFLDDIVFELCGTPAHLELTEVYAIHPVREKPPQV